MRNWWLIIVVIVVVAGVIFLVRSPEDDWIMVDGKWVKHGHPMVGPEGQSVVLYDPVGGETISSPLVLAGEALGTWYFEGSFPIELQDKNAVTIAQTVAQAQGDWMTEEFVPFTATLTFDKSETDTGALLFRKDNPSGDPDLDAVEVVSVKF